VEARAAEDGIRFQDADGDGVRTWSPLVQEWEALKSRKKQFTGERERMSESEMRKIISTAYGGDPNA
jgi:hypothetical protein